MTDIIYEVAAKEVELPIDKVHADPFQPRVHPDAELAESIKSQGILQAIRVELAQPIDAICEHCDMTFVDLAALGDFMIQDGERRFLGAIAAGHTTILAKVVPPATESDRLLKQLTSNTGKPLTPVEEAFAFKRIMDAEGWSQNELAKQLGRPRSVVGDRIRLAELHPAWLELIGKGALQPSHAAILSPYSAVPDEYQEKAAALIAGDYRITSHTKAGEPVPLADFQYAIYGAYRDFIKPLSDVKGYEGPVIEVPSDRWNHDKKQKCAADIKLWRPIFNKLERERTKAMRVNNGSQRQPQRRAVEKQLAALALPERKSDGYGRDAKKGEAEVYNSRGWEQGIDPKTFLAHANREKLVLVKPKHGEPEIVTSDLAAVALAQDAYTDGYWKSIEGELAKVRKALPPEALEAARVSGPGLRVLLGQCRSAEELSFLGAALGVKESTIDEDDFEDADEDENVIPFSNLADADVERIAAAFVLSTTGKVKLPALWQLKQRYNDKLQAIPFELAAPVKPEDAEKAAKKAKGQELGKEIATARKNGQTKFADTLKAGRAIPAESPAKAEQLEEATA
jgi:ParB/RepB/Spo0J family partition protein